MPWKYALCRAQMEPVRVKRPRYPDTAAQQRQKADVNAWLCDAVLAYGRLPALGLAVHACVDDSQADCCAMVLDAPSFGSSRALLQRGIVANAECLLVPNPLSVDAMRDALDASPDLRGLHLVPVYSGQLLARALRTHALGLCFLDWTCTFAGSKTVRPQKELAAALRRRVFAPHAVLALTLHVPRLAHADADPAGEVVAFVRATAMQCGYGEPVTLLVREYDNLASRMMIVAMALPPQPPSPPAAADENGHDGTHAEPNQ